MNNNIISKELLIAVLGINYNFTIKESKHYELNIVKWWKSEVYKEEMVEINIYELAHKCKEWAWDIKHETIRSGIAEFGGWANLANSNLGFVSMDIPYTETEAIFKACQWILDNKDKQ